MSRKKPAASTSPAPPAVRALRTGDAYARMIAAPAEKRADLYRHELMAPFKAKWAVTMCRCVLRNPAATTR